MDRPLLVKDLRKLISNERVVTLYLVQAYRASREVRVKETPSLFVQREVRLAGYSVFSNRFINPSESALSRRMSSGLYRYDHQVVSYDDIDISISDNAPFIFIHEKSARIFAKRAQTKVDLRGPEFGGEIGYHEMGKMLRSVYRKYLRLLSD